jgi:hypothetical protein
MSWFMRSGVVSSLQFGQDQLEHLLTGVVVVGALSSDQLEQVVEIETAEV